MKINALVFQRVECESGRIGAIRHARSYGVHQCPGIVKFHSAVQADLIGPVLDGEHSTAVAVTTAEGKLENRKQRFHKSSARWRRSQLPLASSQASRERTLARARAMAQSAAP